MRQVSDEKVVDSRWHFDEKDLVSRRFAISETGKLTMLS